jgi:RND superfamily putative drug exporter
MLYRLGRFCARRAWLVLAAWVLVLGSAATAYLFGHGSLSTGFSIPNTKTTQVTDELKTKIPALSGGSGGVVVATRDGSPFSAAQRQAVTALVASAKSLPHVTDAVDPFAIEQQRAERVKQVADGRAQLAAARSQLDQARAQIDAAREQAAQAGQLAQAAPRLDQQQAQLDASAKQLDAQAGLLDLGVTLLDLSSGIRTISADGSTAIVTITFTMSSFELPDTTKQAVIDHFERSPIDGVDVEFSADIAQTTPRIIGVGEAVGVAIAGIVLIVMLGTLIAAGLPILTALTGVGIGVLAALSLSSVVEMASVTPVLGVMLGLAVGIDYALFIINRHRKQLTHGIELPESIGLANGTAGNAVLFAGSTVLVALLALNVTGIPFLGLMGTVGAVCVAVAVLIAVTMTPALLGLIGQRVVGRRARHTAARAAPVPAVRPMSTVRAIFTVLACAAVLLTVAIPAMSMRLGLPDGSAETVESTQYRAYKTTEREFGTGVNGTLLLTARLPAGLDDAAVIRHQAGIAKLVAAQDAVVAVAPIAVSDDHRLAAFQVVPSGGPTSTSTERLVQDLRQLSYEGAAFGVAGQAAANIDISEKLADVLPLYILLVVGLSLIIMIAVFRSFVVPITATAGFVLSLLATYGAIVAIYQWGWLSGVFGTHDHGPILNFLPIVLVGILFGLAMDYQLFLVSGMREAYVHGLPARSAVTWGVRAGRTVVIAAAIIMVAVFSGFIFAESVIIRPVGFGLAFGVLVDAFVVRMLLIPALMHLFGPAAWWFPRWLDRLVPNVDVEGAALERRHSFHADPELVVDASAGGR